MVRNAAAQVGVYLVGCGHVGGALTQLIAQRRERGRQDLCLRAAANSRWMSLDTASLPRQWRAREPVDLTRMSDWARSGVDDISVVVDCTASDAVATLHPSWLSAGLHVVTANKKGNAGDHRLYQNIVEAARHSGATYGCETTVGAALPVISTLRGLLAGDDEILEIAGVLSGSVSHILAEVQAGQRPSAAILAARESGLTEPDPRDDLSGEDVARKLVILARELGFVLEREAVSVESLVPDELRSLSAKAFWRRLPECDDEIANRLQPVGNDRWQYVATLSATGRAEVGPRCLPRSDPMAALAPGDNILLFRTRRYRDRPLSVRGPGAGSEVTAGGLLSELTGLSRSIPQAQKRLTKHRIDTPAVTQYSSSTGR